MIVCHSHTFAALSTVPKKHTGAPHQAFALCVYADFEDVLEEKLDCILRDV